MNLKRYTLLALSSVLFCACNNDDDTTGNYPSDGLVRINTMLSDLSLSDLHSTRADGPTRYTGTDLSLWIDYGTSNPYYASNVKFTQTDNKWNSTSVPSVCWKDAGSSANIYAYAPYIETPGADPKKIPFVIASDQDKDNGAGLAQSDLVGFSKIGFVPGTELNKSLLDITFKHKLSKLTLAFSFSGQEQAIESVALNGTDLNVVYDATTATATTSSSGTPTSIVMHKAEKLKYEAILAPQSLAAGTNMVTVTLTGGVVSSYVVPTGVTHTFAAGNDYSMNLTMGKGVIKFDGMSVKEWGDKINVEPGNVTNLLNIEYCPIPATTADKPFMMGSPEGEGVETSEKPQHLVPLSAFLMSKTEITNAQYCTFLNANKIDGSGIWPGAKAYKSEVLIWGSKAMEPTQDWGVNWEESKWVPATGKENYPVVFVTWYGAKEFANWVGGDLPTEAQWEYACRAATTAAWWSGPSEADLQKDAWFNINAGSCTHEVKTTANKRGNAWGLYDMHGNVAEWCNDWFDERYYDSDGAKSLDPKGPESSPVSYRVLRGGFFGSVSQICRSAFRDCGDPNSLNSSGIGFRVVVSSKNK